MRRLILLRHGAAEISGVTGGDRERPLAKRGRAEVALTCQWLLAAGYAPEVVHVSSALRTQATWGVARETFPQARAETVDSLYMADGETIVDVLDNACSSPETVMVVGHNPGLQELGLRLAIDAGAAAPHIDRIAEGFPTGAAVVFRMNGMNSVGLEAIHEPPERVGEEPRWAFFSGSRDHRRVTRIYKLLERQAWEAALIKGRYDGSSLDMADGYIHFSTAAQAPETARRHFAGVENLLLLTVDVEGLGTALRWEVSRGGGLFPHLYGPLPLDLVLEARPSRLDKAGVPVLGVLTP
jgi:uncharacterized protein (DUF952 family)/phosphohistidine phosphatase SixA